MIVVLIAVAWERSTLIAQVAKDLENWVVVTVLVVTPGRQIQPEVVIAASVAKKA